MEIPYLTLLGAAWGLWWRNWAVMLVIATLFLLPLLVLGTRYPLLWEALKLSQVGSPAFAAVVFLAFNLLAGYPMAVRWLLRGGRGSPLVTEFFHVSSSPRSSMAAVRKENRKYFLLAWVIFWMPFLWDAANLGLLWVLATTNADHKSLVPAMVAIAVNSSLASLLAILPLNVRWALGHSLMGARWKLPR